MSDSEERSGDESARDGEDVGVDARCQDIISFIFENGRSKVGRLTRHGHFDYYVYKPHWIDLVQRGILKKNEQGELCLTWKAGPYAMKNWSELSLWRRIEETHLDQDNAVDLGLLSEAVITLRRLLSPEVQGPAVESSIEVRTSNDYSKYLESLDVKELDRELVETFWNSRVWRRIDSAVLAEHYRREQERGLGEKISDVLFRLF